MRIPPAFGHRHHVVLVIADPEHSDHRPRDNLSIVVFYLEATVVEGIAQGCVDGVVRQGPAVVQGITNLVLVEEDAAQEQAQQGLGDGVGAQALANRARSCGLLQGFEELEQHFLEVQVDKTAVIILTVLPEVFPQYCLHVGWHVVHLRQVDPLTQQKLIDAVQFPLGLTPAQTVTPTLSLSPKHLAQHHVPECQNITIATIPDKHMLRPRSQQRRQLDEAGGGAGAGRMGQGLDFQLLQFGGVEHAGRMGVLQKIGSSQVYRVGDRQQNQQQLACADGGIGWQQKCCNRESNSGLSDGNAQFYHQTIAA